MRRFIVIALLLTIIIVFFLFSDSGLQAIQGIADSNQDASWAPLVYYDIANLHAVAGRHERSIEVYDVILNTYWYESKDKYVENKYGEYYAAYALFYKAETLERIAKSRIDEAYRAQQDGDIETYKTLRVESVGLYQDARIAYKDFMSYFGLIHELYSNANSRQSKLVDTIYEIAQGN